MSTPWNEPTWHGQRPWASRIQVGVLVLVAACSSSSDNTETRSAPTTLIELRSAAAEDRILTSAARPATAPRELCSWESVEHKAKQAPHLHLECEWKSARRRTWGKKMPTEEVVVAMIPGTNPGQVAEDVGALNVQKQVGAEDGYTLRFATTDAAIDAIPWLICSRDVRWASMALLWAQDDSGEWYDWCQN